MSVYNGEQFLRPAVDSILGQTYRDFEFLVINDGSTDRSAEILAAISDPRLRVVHQANAGLTRSLNRGIGLSGGDYVARMDADDVAHPHRLERQVAFMDANPRVGLLGTAYHEIDAEGRVIDLRVFPTEDAGLRAALIRYNPFFHASVMVRREVFREVGVYDERLPPFIEDYELWFRVARRFELANLAEPLGMRRYDGGNLSIRRDNTQLASGIWLRWQVIRRGDYPPWKAVYLARPLAAWLTPTGVRNWVRRHVLGRRF